MLTSVQDQTHIRTRATKAYVRSAASIRAPSLPTSPSCSADSHMGAMARPAASRQAGLWFGRRRTGAIVVPKTSRAGLCGNVLLAARQFQEDRCALRLPDGSDQVHGASASNPAGRGTTRAIAERADAIRASYARGSVVGPSIESKPRDRRSKTWLLQREAPMLTTDRGMLALLVAIKASRSA